MALGLAWRSRVLDAAGGRHRTQSAGCPAAAAASRRWRRCVVAAAATQQGAAAAAEPQQRVERVLRYPDGNERRIIYPTTTPSEDAQRASALLAEEGLDEDGFSAWAFSDTELVRGPALSLSRGGGARPASTLAHAQQLVNTPPKPWRVHAQDEMMTSWSECSLAGAACIVQVWWWWAGAASSSMREPVARLAAQA